MLKCFDEGERGLYRVLVSSKYLHLFAIIYNIQCKFNGALNYNDPCCLSSTCEFIIIIIQNAPKNDTCFKSIKCLNDSL